MKTSTGSAKEAKKLQQGLYPVYSSNQEPVQHHCAWSLPWQQNGVCFFHWPVSIAVLAHWQGWEIFKNICTQTWAMFSRTTLIEHWWSLCNSFQSYPFCDIVILWFCSESWGSCFPSALGMLHTTAASSSMEPKQRELVTFPVFLWNALLSLTPCPTHLLHTGAMGSCREGPRRRGLEANE